MAEVHEKRARFDRAVSSLVGRVVESVNYWDMEPLDARLTQWDYGEWHHVVMGVEFGTDRGPVSLVGTNTFWPYGIEAIAKPMSALLNDGGERRDVTGAARWEGLLPSPIRSAAPHWEQLTLGGPWPKKRSRIDLPVGMRLEFEAGPVWVVVGIPQAPDMREVFMPGDEMLVIFTPERVREIGSLQAFVE
jgi:hypothetical protein